MFNHTNSSPEVTNCTFSGNSVIGGIGGQDGGGMVNANNSNPRVTNCTFSGNTAGLDGGGMLNSNSFPLIRNCIFWGNSDSGGSDETAQIHEEAGSASIVNYSNIQGGWAGAGTNNIDSDPMFLDPDGADNILGTEDDDLRLLPGSPCIDAGDNDAVPADLADLDNDGDTLEPIPFDLDGNPRFADDPATPDTGNGAPPIVDMGAYEFLVADADGDGVPDDVDNCQDSDLGESIMIDDCDTGVANELFDDGCTMADLIMLCAEDAANHGRFVSCVAHLAKEWKHEGLITGR